MLKYKFIKVFPKYYYKIKTKFDLYFLAKMLEEIMTAFEGVDGVVKVCKQYGVASF